MDTIIQDTKCPYCNQHPSGEANYKFKYCKDCGDETKEVCKKDQDKNFVCPTCVDNMINEDHMRHVVISVTAYLNYTIKKIFADYGDVAKRNSHLTSMKKFREEVTQNLKHRYEFVKHMEEIGCATALLKDYNGALELPKQFEIFLEQLEQLFLDREVLMFREHLLHYKEFLDEFKRLSYLVTVDDDYLMMNY